MAIARLALAQVAWRARPGAAAALLGTTTTAGLLARARQRRACAAGGAVCDSLEREPERWRRPAAGTSGACPQSGVRFYAARSRKAAESMHCYAIAEDLHQFSIVDGMPDVGQGAAECAKLCAGKLVPLVARGYAERVRRLPLRSATDRDGNVFGSEEEAAAAYWADALTDGFAQCDQLAAQDPASGSGASACGALLCVVAESGVYVASVGLGRACIGTEIFGGEIMCDEASIPHCSASEAEAERLREADASAASLPPPHLATRMLGGSTVKQADPRVVGLPDVVRHQHSEGRRFVILASPGIWDFGPRLPVQWAVEAYRRGRSPADELVARSRGADDVALVLVLPAGLGTGDGRLPPHEELRAREAAR